VESVIIESQLMDCRDSVNFNLLLSVKKF